MQPKLTPTTNDRNEAKRGKKAALAMPQAMNGTGAFKLRITPPHEPLAEDPSWTPPIPVEERTVNVLPVVPAAEPQPLKVALIGTAPSSRLLAPYGDPSWKIWACSPGNMVGLPRIDMWFEIHGNLLWPEYEHYGKPYLEWLNKQTFPIYMQDNKLVPKANVLPYRELVKEFGPYFFTSSFSWMMAFAIYSGCKELALYGIDMASRDEYILQRPGAYHFFNECRRRGIKFSAPYESDILQPPGLYGYSEVTPMGRKLLARKKELTDRKAQIDAQIDQLTKQKIYMEGALEDNDYQISIFIGAQNNSILGESDQ